MRFLQKNGTLGRGPKAWICRQFPSSTVVVMTRLDDASFVGERRAVIHDAQKVKIGFCLNAPSFKPLLLDVPWRSVPCLWELSNGRMWAKKDEDLFNEISLARHWTPVTHTRRLGPAFCRTCSAHCSTIWTCSDIVQSSFQGEWRSVGYSKVVRNYQARWMCCCRLDRMYSIAAPSKLNRSSETPADTRGPLRGWAGRDRDRSSAAARDRGRKLPERRRTDPGEWLRLRGRRAVPASRSLAHRNRRRRGICIWFAFLRRATGRKKEVDWAKDTAEPFYKWKFGCLSTYAGVAWW